MNTNQVCPPDHSSSKPLPVRLDPFPVDERAIYIDSICAVLIDSRFGPGRSLQRFEVHLSEYPESVVDLDVLCDLTIDRAIPSYAFLPVGRLGYQVVEDASRKAKQIGFMDARPNSQNPDMSPSHLVRGSPQNITGTHKTLSSVLLISCH